MADTLKKLYNGTLTTTLGTKYTVPESTITIVKEIMLCNYSGTAVTATVSFAGSKVVAKTIEAGDTIREPLSTIMITGDIIAASASANTSIDIYLSGIEVA